MSSSTKTTFNFPVMAEELVHDNSSRTFYFASILISIVMMAVIGVVWTALPMQVPIFFTYPWGEARLAHRLYLLLLPFFSVFFVIVNILMGKFFRVYPVILSRILATTSLTTAIMFGLSIVGIIQSLL